MERLTTPPTDDEREALEAAIDPDGDLEGYVVEGITDRILDAGFRRQGSITDEWEYAWRTDESHVWPYDQYDHEGGDTLTEVVDVQAEPWWQSEVVEGMSIHRRRKATPAGPWEPVEAVEDAS